MQVVSAFEGIMMLAIFYAAMILLSVISVGKSTTKNGFLVANRKLGLYESGFSIAATWIWAPALFVAAQKAYQQGWVGLFWFLVPNVACLIVFSEFAMRLRERLPEGYSLSGYMRERYSKRVQNVYFVELLGLSICSFAVQLLAGGMIFSTLTGLPFFWVTVAMAVIALTYSMWSGLKASVLTDHIQLSIILLVSAVLIPWVVVKAGGWEAVSAGFGGVTGEFTSLFSGPGGSVFFSFGLAVTIGLMSGPFGDQSFWQRALAIERRHVRKAFILGAFVFGIVPLMLSVLGFVAAGAGLETGNAQLINLQTIIHFLPTWTALPFAFVLVCGLVSTLDSVLCAIASIAGADFADRAHSSRSLLWSRSSMACAAILAVVIANVPGMQILYLFLFYGTLRASTLLPTVITLVSDKAKEAGVFWGILASIGIGLPIFAYGNFLNLPTFIVIGSLLTVGLSGAITYMTAQK